MQGPRNAAPSRVQIDSSNGVCQSSEARSEARSIGLRFHFLAQSLEQLVFFRILQGGFGAPLVPLNQAILLDTFPRRQHGTATAFFGMGVVFGPIIGPTVGGYLAPRTGERAPDKLSK